MLYSKIAMVCACMFTNRGHRISICSSCPTDTFGILTIIILQPLHVYVAFLIVLYSTVCVIAAKRRADFGPRGSGSECPASLDAGCDGSWSGGDSGG